MTTVLITGAARGIGHALCRACAARGDTVIATARRPSDALNAMGVRVEMLDVADDASARALGERLEGVRIDVVIHNAAASSAGGLQEVSTDEVRMQMEVNALGPLRVTQALLPHLSPGARIALITSRMGSVSDNTSGGFYAYRMSKAALNMFGRSLAQDVAARGIAVVTLHPGMVDTDMLRSLTDAQPSATGARSAGDVAADLLTHIDALTLASTGRFLHANGEELAW